MNRFGRWRLAVKVLPLVLLAVCTKAAVQALGLEVLTLSSLFSGIVGATVFLLGFMIAGTLTDYKESERLPSDLAASLHSIADECDIAAKGKGKKTVNACRKQLADISSGILGWLRNSQSAEQVLADIRELSDRFVELEPYVQATFINRLKTEQNQIRRMVLRMRTIRETSFVKEGYAIAEISATLLITGLILNKNDSYIEPLFFIGIISFILTYMIALIKDLDNPFDYTNEPEGNEVSLKPLVQLETRLRQ